MSLPGLPVWLGRVRIHYDDVRPRGTRPEVPWNLYDHLVDVALKAKLDGAGDPRVRVMPAYSKNRKPVFQPLPPETAEILKPWLAARPRGKPTWRKPHNPCRIWLQKDLAAAGVP
jgi:hypothetical protein